MNQKHAFSDVCARLVMTSLTEALKVLSKSEGGSNMICVLPLVFGTGSRIDLCRYLLFGGLFRSPGIEVPKLNLCLSHVASAFHKMVKQVTARCH